jgi:hypothetical protein
MKYFGMTCKSEQDWLRNYTENVYTGEGEIIELGSWMGSYTIPLATGLMRRKYLLPHRKIHSFDKFIWENWMNEHSAGVWHPWREGQSFLPEYVKRIGYLNPYIQIHAGDLLDVKWEWPVEFICVDAMKSWELVNVILKQFYTKLVPEKSRVFHQDFKYEGCPWIHLVHWVLKDYFWIDPNIEYSTTVVFRLHKPIPPELLLKNYSILDFSPAVIEEAFKYAHYCCGDTISWSEIDKAEKKAVLERKQAENG